MLTIPGSQTTFEWMSLTPLKSLQNIAGRADLRNRSTHSFDR
jgi:hypothetical protein